MSRSSRFAALAVFAAVIASSSAYARTNRNAPLSDMDIRQQCYAEAKTRWPSSNQEMQTNRDFAYQTCVFDRGVRNP